MDALNECVVNCVEKTRRNIDVLRPGFPRYPHTVRDGKTWNTSGDEEWERLEDGYWTPGFWVGILWLCHALTGEAGFAAEAVRWMEPLAPRSAVTSVHDLGFLFFPSAVLGYEITGEKRLREIAVAAARSLLVRFQPEMGMLNVHDSPRFRRVAAVDTMMNLPLLWWAWRETGEGAFREAAACHAANTWRLLVRDDRSTAHVARFHEDGRDVLGLESWQGLGPDSCWSRGHAWAVAGFAHAFRYTGDEAHLERVEELFGYYRKNAPEDGVPFWDFDDLPAPGRVRDASAAAIVAHGLLTASAAGGRRLGDEAEKILHALAGGYAAPPGNPGFIARVCFHKPAGVDTDCSAVFADYYFLSALYLRLRGAPGSAGKAQNRV
ncbi:MAG: glycoside hydrolase family 88 protein [bacterium]